MPLRLPKHMKSSFLIVADRGNLKAFRIEPVPNNRPPRLQLVQALTLTDAHTKVSDRNTDMAGRFPQGSAPGQSQGRHQNAIAEQHLDIEIDRRIVKQLAGHISNILEAEQPESWCFAAPSTINSAVLDELGGNFKNRVAENITADLVNIDTSSLLNHFPSVKAA